MLQGVGFGENYRPPFSARSHGIFIRLVFITQQWMSDLQSN